MAYERLSDRKVIGTNLNAFIQSNLTLLKNQRTQRNLEDEAKFQEAVLADNLSLDDQLKYRMEQAKRVKGDRDEVRRVRTEIAALKDRIEMQKFQDEYVSKVDALNSGAASIDSTISWVTDRLKVTTDLNIKSALQQSLSQLTQKRFTLQQNTLEQQTNYAVNDKSESVLQEQIDRVTAARKDAILSGNDNYSAVLDLQLQGLNKALTETRISNTLLAFSTDTITGQSAAALLDKFNQMISTADTKTPITVGGVRYNNAQEFWNSKRADYLNDNGENGFFGRYQNEINKNVTYQTSKGIFKTDSLKQVSDSWDSLRFRPELKDYSTNIDQNKQTALQSAADIRANQVINQFATDYDAPKAVRELGTIQDTYGVDQTTNYQKVLLKVAETKDAQFSSILQAMAQIKAGNPSITEEQAFKQAVNTPGVGAITTPTDLANKGIEDVFKDSRTQVPTKDTTSTINPAAEGNTFQKPNLVEGGVYKLPSSPTGYVFKNGQLQPLADQFNADEFKKATGKSFDQIETLPSFGNTPIGPGLTKSQLITSPPATQPGAPTQGLQIKPLNELVDRRPSASNPKVYEYYRKDTNQGLDEKGLFDYVGQNGYADIKDFKTLNPALGYK